VVKSERNQDSGAPRRLLSRPAATTHMHSSASTAYCLRQQLNQSNTRRRSYPTMPAAHHDTTQRLHAATRAVFSLSLRWLDHDPAPFRCLLCIAGALRRCMFVSRSPHSKAANANVMAGHFQPGRSQKLVWPKHLPLTPPRALCGNKLTRVRHARWGCAGDSLMLRGLVLVQFVHEHHHSPSSNARSVFSMNRMTRDSPSPSQLRLACYNI
jgi:hypothetical protein